MFAHPPTPAAHPTVLVWVGISLSVGGIAAHSELLHNDDVLAEVRLPSEKRWGQQDGTQAVSIRIAGCQRFASREKASPWRGPG
jgi:hypothetical protein